MLLYTLGNRNYFCFSRSCRQRGRIHTRCNTAIVINTLYCAFFLLPQQSLVHQGLLIIEASKRHSDASRSLGLLWTSDQREHRDLYLHNTQHSHETKDLKPQFQKASGRRPTPYTARSSGSSHTLYCVSDHL